MGLDYNRGQRGKKLERLINLVRQSEVNGLVGTEIRMNVSRRIVEDKLERLLKLETEGSVAHIYNCNGNIDIIQEGGTCAAILDNLANIKIKMEHDPTGLGRWTSFRI